MRLPPQQKMCAAIYNFWETLTVFCSFAVSFSMKRPHKRSIDEAPYGLMSVYERNESRPHKNVSLCVPQSAVSRHNMSYWKGRQYIGVGPGDLLSRLLRSINYCTGGNMYICPATGAHGRFVLRGEGGVVREARTQTLEPDVWICEVQQRGHGTRRRIQLGHLELWAVALRGSRVVSGNEYIYIYSYYTRSCRFHKFWARVKCSNYISAQSAECVIKHSMRRMLEVVVHVLVLSNILSLWNAIIRLVHLLTASLLLWKCCHSEVLRWKMFVWQIGGGVGDGNEDDRRH